MEVPTEFGNFLKCGEGQTDTTKLGNNSYSLRFEPTIPGTNLEWSHKVPIGDIQEKTMAVMCKIKINHENYYKGSIYQLPRLEINFDDGSIAYASVSNSTEEQTLIVPFIAYTDFPEITITISGHTDALGSERYFYVGDGQIFYPPAHSINTGSMDYWVNDMPLTPWMATNIQAADIWAYLTSLVTVNGSIGKMIDELHKIQGLDISNPMTVTPTLRTAGNIDLELSGDGESITIVTRKE